MKHILSGIISSSRERDEVLTVISNIRYLKSHIRDLSDLDADFRFISKTVFKFFEESGGGLLDRDIFEAVLARASMDSKEKTKQLSLFVEASKEIVSHEKFKFFVDDFSKQKESLWIADIQTKAMIALESKFVDDKKIIYSGPEGASQLLAEIQFNNPYRRLFRSYPEGDIRGDGEDILLEYEHRKLGVKGQNELYSGWKIVDDATGGFKRGELIMIGAYTGEGKSLGLANIAHHACINQRKNGVIITLETSRSVYRRRILTRHSCVHSIGRPQGIDSAKLRDGKLSKDEELLFLNVVTDFTKNPDYGYLDIVQMKKNSTMSDMHSKLEEINKRVPLDYAIIDYFSLVAPTRRRSSRREEIEEILQEAKDGALSFDNGKGIVLLGAHQMKQSAREKVKAEDAKFYTIRDFADSSEAGESADVALMFLRTDELKDANELAAKLTKLRDGEAPPMFKLYERFSTSFIGNLAI